MSLIPTTLIASEASPAKPRLSSAGVSARAYAFLRRGSSAPMFSGFMIVASLTLVAKAVSFFKDAVVADRFGTSNELDAFMLSFSLLTFLAAVIGGGMPESFLPAFSKLADERSIRRAHRLGIQITLCNIAVFTILGSLIWLAAPAIVALAGRGFAAEKQVLALRALRDLVPFFFFFGLSYHFATWLRAQKRFTVATASALSLPAVLMICLFWAGESAELGTLVFGTTLGAILQTSWLAATITRDLPRDRRWLWLASTRWEPRSREVLRNAFPFLLGGVIMGSSTMVDQAMAAWLEPGSVVVFSYADKICGIVLALTAVPAGEALFPYFADAVASRDWPGVRRQLVHSVGTILSFAFPMTLVLVVAAPFIVRLLFERGAFHADDSARVAEVLRFAALQIPFYITGVLASRIAVSLQAAQFLLLLSIALMTVNVGLNAWFMHYWGVAGIALSTVVVHLVSAAALLSFVLIRIARLSRDVGSSPNKP